VKNPRIPLVAPLLLALLCAPTIWAMQLQVVQAKAPVPAVHRLATAPSLDLCPTCVNFMSQFLNQLIEIILNGGVIGSCGKLCSLLNGSSVEQTVCDLLCDAVGIDVFIKLVDDADPDPIYICEVIKICPVSTTGNATIDDLSASPAKGRVGATIKVTIDYSINSNIGTGEFALQVLPIDIGTAQPLFSPANGEYSVSVSIPTKPNKNNPWQPGVYEIQFFVCAGSCGSKHPNAQLLASASTNFTLTQ